MKKKILAAALAAVVAFNICTVRPRAEVAVGSIITIGVLAWNLLGVMTGDFDGARSGIAWCIQSNIDSMTGTFDALINPDSDFQVNWRTGFNTMCNTIQSWVDSGEATIDGDGNLHMDYKQYVELYNQLIQCCDLTVDFGEIGVPYSFIPIQFSSQIPVLSVPFYSAENHHTYISVFPVYYNDNSLYINADQCFRFLYDDNSSDGNVRTSVQFEPGFSSSMYPFTYDDLMARLALKFAYIPSENCITSYSGSKSGLSGSFPYREISTKSLQTWLSYNFDDGLFYDVSTESVDTTLSTGYIVCAGHQSTYISSLRSSAVPNVHPDQDLDDLSDTLPLDKTTNPGLVISSNPSITLPTDAVTVSNVPGVADTTLTNYMTEVDTDIDVPSIIIEKFPFCIPYDFIRIIGVLCADPEPPIFRIPISTNPDNLKGFEGNQTVGIIPDDFEPMFEIDEEIVIDLSAVPLVQPICYTIFIVGFVVLLIVLTPKLIQH